MTADPSHSVVLFLAIGNPCLTSADADGGNAAPLSSVILCTISLVLGAISFVSTSFNQGPCLHSYSQDITGICLVY